MKLKKLHKLFILLLVITSSCITPIDVTIDEEINVLVIDGFITTENGPHEIRVTRSAKFGDIFVGTIEQVSRALVLVRDQNGEVVELIEERPGLYLTPETFKGEIGSTYTLLVETAAGESYSSFPQTINPAPQIEDVFYQFTSRPTADPDVNLSGLDVFIQFDDPADEDNFYLWEVDGVHTQLTNPELFRDPLSQAIAPKSCCSVCYITDAGIATNILSDAQINGNQVVQKIAFLQDDQKRFQDAYRISVKHYSIGDAAFEFFRVLKNQLEIQGSIFDPPPATIGSNIINLNDPDAPTIGYFGAFDVRRFEEFVDLDLISQPREDAVVHDDCRLLLNSTDIRPEEWN